jgi:hypothetical protein
VQSPFIWELCPTEWFFNLNPEGGLVFFSLFYKLRMRLIQRFTSLICLLLTCCDARAQEEEIPSAVPLPDTFYVSDHSRELTVRLFGSRKFTSYRLRDYNFQDRVSYSPNSPFNVGFGFNYRFVGINLGFNLPVINDTKEHGKTNFLDLQTHLYGRKVVVDFYGQFYKGYYLTDPGTLENHPDVYIRPDIRTVNIGIVGQYIIRGDRFSFRAAYLQNEYQKKSAGSFIIGGAISAISIGADSSIVPGDIRYDNFFKNTPFDHSLIYSTSFNAGYAYTLVIADHFFVTASVLGGIGINYSILENEPTRQVEEHLGSEFNSTLRFAFGYNSHRYFAGLHYVGAISTSSLPIPAARQQFGSGNLRISIARRFPLKKKLLGFY